jgi:hypothetical protein
MEPADPYVLWNLTAGNLIALAAVVFGPISAGIVALRVQSRQHAHERRRDQTAREQERMARTYVDVFEYVAKVEDWVDRTEPFMTTSTAPGPPDLPTDEELRRLRVQVTLFGSQAILDKLAELRKAAKLFEIDVGLYRVARGGARPDLANFEGPARRGLDENRQLVRKVVRAIEQVARDDLSHKRQLPSHDVRWFIGGVRRRLARLRRKALMRLRPTLNP